MTRLTFLVIVVSITLTGVLFANVGKSQDISEVNVSINYKNAQLDKILNDLEKQSGFTFTYPEEIGKLGPLTIRVNDQSLLYTLKQLANIGHLNFKQINTLISVGKTHPLPKPPPPGSVKGRIVEFETSQPLPGASIYIVELQKGVTSDLNGYYTLANIPPGKYVLKVTYVSFKTENIAIEINEGKEVTYDVKLQADNSNNLSEVRISGTRKSRAPVAHTTDRQIVEELKAAQSVVSGISSEQISKSADRNAAEVVRKIAGVTVRDDKFIIIRGLNERYNITYLNGNIAPSTELYSRAFSLDLIPSRIIDRILVYKSAAPDLSADMTGGAIKIFTKDAKNVKHFDVELQLGDRPGTTFNNNFLTYQGGKFDFLGFDDGTRKLPSSVPGFGDFTKANISQATYAKTFSPTLQYGTKTAAPTMQLTINNYDSFKLAGKSLSYLTSFSYKNDPQQLNINRTQGNITFPNAPSNSDPGTILSKVSNESQNNEVAQLSLLQNFSYHLSDSSNIYFKNFLLQQGQNSTILRNTSTSQFQVNGVWQDSQAPGFDPRLRDIILSYSQRFLYSGNLGGSHYFGKGNKQQLDWNGGYTYSRLDVPDQRAIHLQNSTSEYQNVNIGDYEQNWIPVYRSEDISNNNIDLGMISRVWIRNTEQVYNGSADYTYKVLPWVTLKAGTYQQWKERVVFRRVYTVNEGDLLASGYYPPGSALIGATDPNMDFNLVFFHQQNLGQVWSNKYLRDDGTGLKVFDRTSGSDAYTATEQNNSGYIAASLLPFNGKLDIYGGLRVEYNRQKVAGSLAPTNISYVNVGGINTPVFADLKATTYLPSLNIGYRPDNSFVFRGAYGKTVNRPEFRELSPYSELDYVNNQTIQGNPNLVSAIVNNYDLRMEWYPHANAKGESISIGGFYKDITHPIERIISKDLATYAGYSSAISFLNADKAIVKGLEVDIRKDLDFLPGNFFNNLSLIANGSWIYSKATRKQDTTQNQSSDNPEINRQLQGQSPYSVNIGLYYENAGSGTKIAIIGNQVGPRIYAASIGRQASYNGVASDPGSQASLIELTRRQLDFSLTQRLIKSLQLKLSVQNLLNDPVQMAEDANFTYKYEKAYIITPSKTSATSINGAKMGGDILASDYNPGRFFLLTLTYGF